LISPTSCGQDLLKREGTWTLNGSHGPYAFDAWIYSLEGLEQKWDIPAETRYNSTEMTITNRKVMKTYLAIYI